MRTRVPRVVRIYQIAAIAARLTPIWAMPAASALFGLVLGPRRNNGRAMIERNLRRSYGQDLQGRKLNKLVRATYSSYARYYMESFKLPSLDVDAVARNFRVDGYEHIDAAIKAKQGPILALPHLGGWEWAGFWLALIPQVQVTAVAEELDPPELSTWFTDLRARLGMNIVTLGPDAGSKVNKAIRDNHVTCLLSDRWVGGTYVEVKFFGETTKLPAGPATLALRTGAPLLPTGVFFDGIGHHAVVRPPIDVTRTGRLRDDVALVTQRLADELEYLIRLAPEQWHLMQPNWPSDYESIGRDMPDRD